MKAWQLLLQVQQLFKIERIRAFSGAINQVNILVGNIVVVDVLDHRPERRYTGSGANHEDVCGDWICQHEMTLRATNRKGCTDCCLIEKIGCSETTFHEDNDQFKNIGSIWCRCDGIASPALVGLFVNGKILKSNLSSSGICTQNFLVEAVSFSMRMIFPVRHGCAAICQIIVVNEC